MARTSVFPNEGAQYQNAIMGYHVDLESHTAKGRADLVVRTADAVYIFEFKLMSAAPAEEALNQINEKCYADKYRMSGKKIVLYRGGI